MCRARKRITNGVTYRTKRGQKRKDGIVPIVQGTFLFISASKKNTKPYAATSISPIVLPKKPCTLVLNWLLLFPSEHMALNPHFLSDFGIQDHLWSPRYCIWKDNSILDLLQTNQNNYCGTNGAFTPAKLVVWLRSP